MPSGIVLVLIVLAVGGSAFCVGLFLARTVASSVLLLEARQRVEAERAAEGGPIVAPPRGLRASPLARWLRALRDVALRHLGDTVRPLVTPRLGRWLQRRFVTLGRPDDRPEDFAAAMLCSALFFGLLALLALALLRRPLLPALAVAVLGLGFPLVWLRDQTLRRHRAIRRALPYHLDLLTLSVEAGLEFGQALGTVVERGQPGPLNEEIALTLKEMRLGKTREEALRALADRVQLAELTNFLSNLIQVDKLGTSLGRVLRIQSTQLRVARMHRAEKEANQAPVRLLLPLVACFFPTLFMILFGPIVYRFIYGG